MFNWLGRAFGSIGEGWASIMNACTGTSRFDDYKHLMPRGREVKLLTPEDVLRTDAQALRADQGALTRWEDIGQWSDIGKHWGDRHGQ